MSPKILLIALVMAALAACGSSEDDKIVLKQPDGTEMTYKEVVEKISSGGMGSAIEDCAAFALVGQQEKGMKYPSGQGEFVKACEEGLKR